MPPAGDSPKTKYQKERARLEDNADADGNPNGFSQQDADLILEFLDALDPDNYGTHAPNIGEKSYSTLEAYAQNLRLTAKATDKQLADLTDPELNAIFSDMGQRLSQNTVQQRQSSARVFYRYHDQLDVDDQAIYIVKNQPSAVDPRDLFTREELDAMRAACDNPRDRVIIDMAVYTGQRIRALQTLRVQDVDIEEGRFYLNPDAFGLKGAKGMRSLLLAKSAAAEWMDYHPDSDNPDAYFITKLPDAGRGDTETPLYQSTINRRIEAIAKKAGIDRPEERGHAHNLRHTFVRWAYVKRGMDLATIKWMMGHSKDSRTLEETYFNILDVDHAQKAEEAAGVAEPDDVDDLVPETCPTCDYSGLPANAKACPRCGSVFSPDAAEAQKTMQEQAEEQIPQVESEAEARAVAAVLKQLRENPTDAVDDESES